MSPLFPLLLAALVVVGATGLLLAGAEHPFSRGWLSVHKLVDLGVLIGVGVLVARAAGVAPLSRVALTAVGAVAVLQLVTLVSGGVVAAVEPAPRWARWTHRVVSWIAMALTAWWAVLFLL